MDIWTISLTVHQCLPGTGSNLVYKDDVILTKQGTFDKEKDTYNFSTSYLHLLLKDLQPNGILQIIYEMEQDAKNECAFCLD